MTDVTLVDADIYSMLIDGDTRATSHFDESTLPSVMPLEIFDKFSLNLRPTTYTNSDRDECGIRSGLWF